MAKQSQAGFGVGLYFGEGEAIEITRDELIALRAFDLVYWSGQERRFRAPSAGDKNVAAFLKQYRMGLR
jgi:hypothetical protein